MTPEYLNELANLADPEELWRRSLLGRDQLTPEQKRQLDAGVALRRHAAHVSRMRELLGTGKSLLLTPMGMSSQDIRTVPMPQDAARLLRQQHALIVQMAEALEEIETYPDHDTPELKRIARVSLTVAKEYLK